MKQNTGHTSASSAGANFEGERTEPTDVHPGVLPPPYSSVGFPQVPYVQNTNFGTVIQTGSGRYVTAPAPVFVAPMWGVQTWSGRKLYIFMGFMLVIVLVSIIPVIVILNKNY